MVHNSPLNTITSQNDDIDAFTDATSKLQEENKRAGLTFGKVDQPVKDQVHSLTGYIIISRDFALVVIILSCIILGVCSKCSFLSSLITSIFAYMGGILAIFELIPQIHFLTHGGSSISVMQAILSDKVVTGFFLLSFLQAIIVCSVPLVWTRPIMPEFHSNQGLRIHLNNWRKYGSWLATVLGGVLLTGVLVFLNNGSPFGSIFIQHVLILIGGAVVLNIGFVVFKLQCIECEIVNS